MVVIDNNNIKILIILIQQILHLIKLLEINSISSKNFHKMINLIKIDNSGMSSSKNIHRFNCLLYRSSA